MLGLKCNKCPQNVIRVLNVIKFNPKCNTIGPKCNRGPKCNNVWC